MTNPTHGWPHPTYWVVPFRKKTVRPSNIQYTETSACKTHMQKFYSSQVSISNCLTTKYLAITQYYILQYYILQPVLLCMDLKLQSN